MARRMSVVVWVAFMGVFAMVLASCGDGTGVCTGCCGPSGTTYCKDGWTEDECADWDAEGVNGVAWSFYEGQTCEERGTPPTP